MNASHPHHRPYILGTLIDVQLSHQPAAASAPKMWPWLAFIVATSLAISSAAGDFSITTASPLPDGVVDTAYSQDLKATGGIKPYYWTISAGSLPTGLNLSNTGSITGTPATEQTSNFTVSVADYLGASAQQECVIAVVAGPVSGYSFVATTPMNFARSSLTATLLSDGKVLVTGTLSDYWYSSAEVYNPTTATWTATGSMHAPREGQAATLLPSGKVLVTGGDSGNSFSQQGSVLFDPATMNWTWSGKMIIARDYHTATLLPNGKVLVAGGRAGGSSAELYEPSTGTWTATGPMSASRYCHTATLLPNGKVLVVGGDGEVDGNDSAELYDPSTGTWAATDSMSQTRVNHTAMLLPNGKVLVMGGQDENWVPLASSEVYDPQSGAWLTSGSMNYARQYHSATLLPGGKVLVTGGDNSINGGSPLAAAEVYDPNTGTWTATCRMNETRECHTATLLPNGEVLVAGGFDPTSNLTSVEIYTPPPNQAPTALALSSSSVYENQPVGTAVGTLSTTDPDVDNTFTYTLVNGAGGTDNTSFTISGSTLKTAASFDYETKNSYSVRLRTTDQGNLWCEEIFTVTVNAGIPPLIITTEDPLPACSIRVAYSQAITATGGTPPYTWSIPDGNFPAGLNLNEDGTITGMYLNPYPETFTFTVQVTDSESTTTTREFTLAVNGPPPRITTASTLPAGVVGAFFNLTLTASGHNPPFTWSLTSGSLAAGLDLLEDGTITGTPGTEESTSFTATVTDATGMSSQREFLLEICPDSALAGLWVWPAALSPQFSAAVASYHVTALTSTLQVELTAALNATIRSRINGGEYATSDHIYTEFQLNMGSNTIDVEVTSPDYYSTQIYTITATRLPGTSCDSSFNFADIDPIAVRSIAIQADGKVLMAVWTMGSDGEACNRFYRVLADGSLDTSFSCESDVSVNAMVVQADGKILVGGSFTIFYGQPCANIARLNADGSLDTTFQSGTDGVVNAMVVQADGKILVGGGSLLRLNADGSLDTTFVATPDIDVACLALQPDGRILVGGASLLRLNADGFPDAAYAPSMGHESQAPYVYSMVAQADGKIVVGGCFTSLNGSPIRSLGRLNSNGTLDTSFIAHVSGGDYSDPYVQSLLLQTDGKLLVAGNFANLGGQPRSNLGRINSDGSIDQNFDPGVADLYDVYGGYVSSMVYCLAMQPDGKILVGGAFSHLGGMSREHLGRLVADDPSAPLLITTLSPLPLGMLGVAYTRNLTATGAATPFRWSICAGRLPNGLFMNQAGVITGTPLVQETESFTAKVIDTNGVASTRYFTLTVGNPVDTELCAMWTYGAGDPGTLAPFFDPAVTHYSVNVMDTWMGVSAVPRALDATVRARINGGVYVEFPEWIDLTLDIGTTTTLDLMVTSGDGLASKTYTVAITRAVSTKLTSLAVGNGTLSPAWNPTETGYSVSLPINYTTITAAAEDPTATLEWRVNGGAYAPLDGSTPQISLAMGNNLIDVLITAADSTTRTYTITAMRVPGSVCDGFAPGAGVGGVSALAVQADGKILAGGSFTSLGGQPRNHLGRLLPDGSLDTAFNPGINSGAGGDVSSIVVQVDEKILVGGVFSTLAGHTQANLGRLHPDGSLDVTFVPTLDGQVYAVLIQSDGKILIGGVFTSVNGETRNGLARLNDDGSLDSGFAGPGSAGTWILTMALQADGKVLAAGFYDGISRFNADGSPDPSFQPDYGHSAMVARVVVQADGKILVGGYFTLSGTPERNNIARLNSDGSVDATFVANTGDAAIRTLACQPDGKILVSGFINTLNGQPREGLGRLHADGMTDLAFNPGTDGMVNCFASQPGGRIVVGGYFSRLGGQARENIARLVAEDQLSPVVITTGSPLPDGIVTAVYAGALTATGGTLPYVWTIPNGSLPNGLNLSEGGSITGTPGAVGTATFTARGTDLYGQFAEQEFSLTINPAPVPPTITTTSPLPGGTVGMVYGGFLTANSGTPPYAWNIPSGSLPAGLTLGADGTISGTPVVDGTAIFTARVTDANSLFVEREFNITITTSLVSWKSRCFTPTELLDPAISGDNSDPDHDGIPNLLEYALALVPTTADPSGQPTAGLDGGHLAFTYRQNKDATDLIFTPQGSSSLATETWSATEIVETSREDKGTYWLVTVRDNSPIPSNGSRFMRLAISMR